MSPVFELHCITHRKNAIYHDYGSGLPDSLVPDNMMIEAKLFQIARQVSDKIHNVHVPVSGRRFHAYISVGEVSSETARQILQSVLQFRRVKMVVLVNDDIDIFDEEQVMWAIATRTQMSRDALILEDLEGSALDPSLPAGVSKTSKMGIDATWKNVVKPLRNKVPDDVLKQIQRFAYETHKTYKN
jgi:2,5-furandicarboxylate decarboxylase 1